MKNRHFPLLALTLLLALVHAPQLPAIEAGQRCYTKKPETPVLAQPDRMASVVARSPWGTEFTVSAVQGRWLNVRRGNLKGWIFAGNVSPDKPPAENKNDFLPSAGDTGAAVAARPLSGTARDYAARTSHGNAAADIEWLERFAATVTPAEVAAYQKDNGKGEYAP